jgi:hypothetical protein
MARHRHEAGRQQRKTKGAHRKARRRRSVLTRTVAAGGAAICIGAAYDMGTPTAEALSILLPGPTVDGVGTTTRINILEGNIFGPQIGFLGGSTSSNSTIGNVAMNLGNNIVNSLLSREIRLGGAAGNGNTTQINILSYNIFNPQFSLGPNVSNNTTVNNVAMGNGNNSTTDATTAGGLLPWFGGAAGNGNTIQYSFLSGNIFNPQWSLFGQNLSNNTAITNVAIGNGNYSATTLALGGFFGAFLFGGGNGNTMQFGFFVSNIYNPQFSWGAGNISNNTAETNTASGNGNNSTNGVTGGGLGTAVGGTIGNGNSTQVSTGSGNIFNDQINVGPFGGTGTGIIPVATASPTVTDSTVQQLVLDPSTVASSTPDPGPPAVSQTGSDTTDDHRNVQASTTARESGDATSPSTDSTDDASTGSQPESDGGAGDGDGTDTGAESGADTGTGDAGAEGGGDSGSGDSGDGGGGDGST